MEKGRIEFDDPFFHAYHMKARGMAIDEGLVIERNTDQFLQVGLRAVLVEPLPIDMIIHCPKCGTQHIDAPDPTNCMDCGHIESMHHLDGSACGFGSPVENFARCGCPKFNAWTNPPHKKHRCLSCNHVFKVANVPTNGVAELPEMSK